MGDLSTPAVLRILGLYVLVASTEMLNGIFRTLYLNRRFGLRRAKQISLLPALAFCLLICAVWVPTIGLGSDLELIALGISLSAFMLTFDVVLGHFVLRMPMAKVLEDLDPRRGSLLAPGLVLMALCPLAGVWLRRL